ncbi:hypothetical protein CKO44_19370 [Rubrivivax gelatinosus]|nr:hypothetical protein [Rubrivivax gelatinosus]
MPFPAFIVSRARSALACSGLLLATAASAGGPSVQDVSVLAGACVNCHLAGAAGTTSIPSLQGFSEEQLRSRLTAFQAGQVPAATVMPRLMRGFDSEQIAGLARWFAQPAAR